MITDLYGGFHSHGTSIAGWFISSEDNMDYFAVPLKKHQFLNRLFWVDEAKFGHTHSSLQFLAYHMSEQGFVMAKTGFAHLGHWFCSITEYRV